MRNVLVGAIVPAIRAPKIPPALVAEFCRLHDDALPLATSDQIDRWAESFLSEHLPNGPKVEFIKEAKKFVEDRPTIGPGFDRLVSITRRKKTVAVERSRREWLRAHGADAPRVRKNDAPMEEDTPPDDGPIAIKLTPGGHVYAVIRPRMV